MAQAVKFMFAPPLIATSPAAVMPVRSTYFFFPPRSARPFDNRAVIEYIFHGGDLVRTHENHIIDMVALSGKALPAWRTATPR
jgi:hypothetical protein